MGKNGCKLEKQPSALHSPIFFFLLGTVFVEGKKEEKAGPGSQRIGRNRSLILVTSLPHVFACAKHLAVLGVSNAEAKGGTSSFTLRGKKRHFLSLTVLSGWKNKEKNVAAPWISRKKCK